MSDVAQYYRAYDEDGRLRRDNAHRVEYLTTTAYFDRLFPAPCDILDVCAGTGVYALFLAERGHRVIAGDRVPEHVQRIREQPNAALLRGIAQCDATNLHAHADGRYDATLCMGAFYHMPEAAEQRQALAECVRVTRPGGLIVIAYISRFAIAVRQCIAGPQAFGAALAAYETGIDTPFVFLSPGEITALTASFGLETVCHLATDGMAYACAPSLNAASEDAFAQWMRFHLATCEEPSLLGASQHGLWVGRRVEA